MRLSARARMRTRWMFALAVAGAYLGLLAAIAFTLTTTGDYRVGGAVGGDNAGPGLAALVHGNLWGYVSHQPIMGLTSILLRLPFLAAAAALGAGNLTAYQLGALACVLPLALIAAWLLGAPGLSRDRRAYGLVALTVLGLSPIFRTALGAGHPEGILAGILGTAAVIAATNGRARMAAVLLGLAVGSQDWALIAVPPVLLALPGRRRELLLRAGAVAALLTAAVWLADPAAFLRAFDNESATRFINPLSLLWPVSVPLHLPNAAVEWVRALPLGMRRPEATLVAVAIVAALGSAGYLVVRRRVVGYQPLAILALLGLLRGVCDSTHEEYYAIAALVPIVAWEAREGRLALMGALMSVRAWAAFGTIGQVSATELYLSSLGFKALFVGYFARQALVLAPRRSAVGVPEPLSVAVRPVWAGAVERTIPVATETEPARAAA